MMTNSDQLVLYQREECPYCQLVRKKLTLLGLPYLSIPVEEKGIDRKELIELSGQLEVPVLSRGDEVIVGSKRILSYLDQQFGDGKLAPMPSNSYGFNLVMEGDWDQVKEKTIEALKANEFGILTEINVQDTLKKKMDVDVPRQIILGACNPKFAHQVMSKEAAIGLLLPCNVTIRELDNGKYLVSVVSPVRLISLTGRSDLLPLAMEVKNKLKAALDQIAA